MGQLQRKIQQWWTLNPMTYDWKKTMNIPENTQEFFNEIDKRFFDGCFFAHYPGKPPFSRLIDYDALRGKRILEIGCGAGSLSAAFAKQGGLISSIDLTQTAVKYTKFRFQAFGLERNVFQMDAENLGFKDGVFDFIWSWGVIHHSEDTDRIVVEMFRALKPGGRLSVMVYNRNSIYFWFYLIIFRGVFCGKLFTHSIQEICNRYSDGLIAKHYTREQFINIFESNNFIEIKTKIYGQKSDVCIMPRKIRVWVIRLIPKSVIDWLVYNFGWFLYLTAQKPMPK